MQDMLFDFPHRDALPERFQKWDFKLVVSIGCDMLIDMSDVRKTCASALVRFCMIREIFVGLQGTS
jgi:hypothetical protein